jgi:iron(III) transport system substrate-binding protein
VTDELVPLAITSDRTWVATRFNLYVNAYNTNVIKKADLPHSYDDLADPKWKGQLAIDTESFDWLATLATSLGEEKTLALFRRIVATNGVSVRKGHSLLANLVAAGEIPLALTAYDYRAKQLVKEGAPVDYFYMKPALALPISVAISRTATHPNAAALFYNFLLTDAQKIYLDRSYSIVNRRVMKEPFGLDLTAINSKEILDQSEKWTKLFSDIFLSR